MAQKPRLLCLVVLAALATISFSSTARATTPDVTTTGKWLVNHLPTSIYLTDKRISIEQDLQYTVSGCQIVMSQNAFTVGNIVLSKPIISNLGERYVVNLRPATGKEIKSVFNLKHPANAPPLMEFWYHGETTINLGDLDEGHVTVQHSSTDDATVALVTAGQDGSRLSFPYSMEDGQLAIRVATAFRHVIGLCGGKSDPF